MLILKRRPHRNSQRDIPILHGSWRQLRPAEQQTPEVVSGASDDVNDPRTPSAGYVGSRAKYYFSRDERNTPKIYIEYYGRRARGPMHPSNVSHSHPHSLSRATRGQSEISYGSRPSSRDSSSRAFESDGSPCFTAASSFRSSTAQTFESSPGPQYGSLSRTYDSEPAHIVDPVPRETNAQAGPSKLPVGTPSPPEPEVNRNPPVESNWRDYTSVNPQTQQYMCLWKNVNDQGVESTCGYRAKKHLVKRHIESVHLHIKLLACPEPGCEKSFSQQTNLNTHINTHTKESPHKCLYKGCNLSFGDPARRHRHMKKKHNHVPSRRRTQGDRDDEWTPEGTIPPPEIPLGDVNAGSREHPNEESYGAVIDDDTDSDDSSVVRVSENDVLSIHSTEAEFLQDHSPDHATPGSDSETEEFCTSWTGGVSHDFCESDDSDEEWKDDEGTDGSEWESSDSEGDGMEVHGLEDDELLASLQEELKRELASLSKPTPYEEVMRTTGNSKHWENAESQRGLGYFQVGHSARTKREHAKKARDKEKENEKSRNSASAALMRNFFARQPLPPTELTPTNRAGSNSDAGVGISTESQDSSSESRIFTGYVSDESESGDELDDEANIEESEDSTHSPESRVGRLSSVGEEEEPAASTPDGSNTGSPHPDTVTATRDRPASPGHIDLFIHLAPPPLKRQRLEVPYREARKQKMQEHRNELTTALTIIDKRIKSAKTEFEAGTHGLQARRASCIRSHLHMVLHNGRTAKEASECAAESHGLARRWGGRMVRKWVRDWVDQRDLPNSLRGKHPKTFSLLDDPAIRAEMRSFVRSNKWSMSPAKLAEFSEEKMVPAAARQYLTHIVKEEIPQGLKKYLELELFPHIHLKPARGVSLRTARRWLHREGFRFLEHKKSLYFDGHERPDVVKYRQAIFLPAMERLQRRLVKYEVGDVSKLKPELPANYVERRLVLVAHDEMTAQANDGRKKSWVLDGEHALKKKGAGRGMHQSDVICSTVGWVEGASQSMEYGKNYEGYWNGEMFVKQLKTKIIPALEAAHGPGDQFLIIVDNSQGHSAYAEDTLLVQRMNMRPGGQQARMRDGWYERDGRRITQPMVFPDDHAEHPGAAKGMKQVLLERGLWTRGLLMKCKKCDSDAVTCCAQRILELQPDFEEQRSLVQEVIEAAGHMCLFLPKYHCELNPIEFFWGVVKRFLRENCDYTFNTLRENLPKALASVGVELIRKWEHRMVRWMEAYRSGLSAKDAQFQVKAFGTKRYKSHRRIPETVATLFDA
ncbi:hypothetical protein EUX98_g1481 [Antrodiella citrinella]|uniref:C2H2-type domain-containing protein n=1 Tax=Antrodiella citrinella TaxID=2447956 RepID=A0A4S4N1E2_9APHY|nr:hypothetical protein EUX98_g1481 [Antrodiella citrinella]